MGRTHPVDRSLEGVVNDIPDAAERLNRVILRQPRERLQELRARLHEQAIARGVWIEKDGVKKVIPLTLRPRAINLACRGYVHHVTWQIRRGLRRLARLVDEIPAIREVLPLTPVEREWISRYRLRDTTHGGAAERIFCRLDALVRLDGDGWRDTLKFVEPNVIGIGGMWYSAAAEQLMMDEVVPLVVADEATDLDFETNYDPRQMLLEELVEHARLNGVRDRTPFIAFVDDKMLYSLGGEFGRLLPWFHQRGIDCCYCDPWELEARGGDVFVEMNGVTCCVDVVYRFLEIGELAEIEAAGHDLSGIRRAFALGIVVPTVGGDIECKSTFEVLTRPDLRGMFSPEQAPVFDAHVLWTRLLFERRTSGPDGPDVDLVPFTVKNRARLVLKPNRSYGGDGVLIGEEATEQEWHDAVDAALRHPGTFVVQQVSPPDVESFPVLDDDGTARLAPFFAATGFYPGKRGLSIFGRYAQSRVVNIARGGGISPFLVEVT